MESVLLTVSMIAVFYGLAAIVMWFDDAAMHKAEHDDVFHEHAHN
jgi:hypothetical protein